MLRLNQIRISTKRSFSTMKKIGIIGTGSLGESLANMLLSRTDKCYDSVTCSVRRLQRKEQLEKNLIANSFSPRPIITMSNIELARRSDCIILSVKPGQVKEVCNEISGIITADIPVISVAAAIPLEKLHQWLPYSKTIIRCMPNVLCGIGNGVVPYTYRNNVNDSPNLIEDLFSPNITLPLKTDKEIDISTLISGCGPAFFSWYADCLKQIGKDTISDSDLNTMITYTMMGTAHMLTHFTTNEIIRSVASPKGATEATLQSFQSTGVQDIILKSLISAQHRITSIIDTL